MILGKKIRDCVPRIATDLPESVVQCAVETDQLVNKCVDRVTDSLKQPAAQYTEMHRGHLAQMFFSMRHTHFTIRKLLQEEQHPTNVDAMPLARCQLETLFAICLIVEQPNFMDAYLKHGWKMQYLYHLVLVEQCRDLPRLRANLDVCVQALDGMRKLACVTDEEKATIDESEIGTPLPAGFNRKPIPKFPAPGEVITRIQNANRQKMLLRLYPEYQFLCTYVHASPHGRSFRALFDKRQPFGEKLFTSGQLEEMFMKEIAAPAILLDLLSLAQCCAEFVSVYPRDVELRGVLSEAWGALLDNTLIGRAVWELHTKQLLGVL